MTNEFSSTVHMTLEQGFTVHKQVFYRNVVYHTCDIVLEIFTEK